jgi:hypothetical protein
MAVFGISVHWPIASAFTQPGRGPGGGTTKTLADAVAVPPVPVQARLNRPVLVSAPVDVLPEVAWAPDQPPEAVQDAAFVEDQVSIDVPPLATDVGFAESDTVTDGGGGVPDTETVADALALPPAPVQVREKLPLAMSGPVDWLPDVALDPNQAPEAEQEAAAVEDQVSVEAPPLATDVGFAAMDTVGLGPAGPLVEPFVEPSESPTGLAPQPANARARTGASRSVFMRNIRTLVVSFLP